MARWDAICASHLHVSASICLFYDGSPLWYCIVSSIVGACLCMLMNICIFSKVKSKMWPSFVCPLKCWLWKSVCMRVLLTCICVRDVYVHMRKHLTETPLFCASSHRGWCDGDIRPSPHLNPHPKGNSPSPYASPRPGNQPETHRRHMLCIPYINSFWNMTVCTILLVICHLDNKVKELKTERKQR